MSQYHSPDGAGGCCITSDMFSRRIGAIFSMLSCRAGLSASAMRAMCYRPSVCLPVCPLVKNGWS